MSTKSPLSCRTLSEIDYQKAIAVLNKLVACHTQNQLELTVQTELLPLVDCDGVFFIGLQQQHTQLKILNNITSESICQCRINDFFKIAIQDHEVNQRHCVDPGKNIIKHEYCLTSLPCPQCNVCVESGMKDLTHTTTFTSLLNNPAEIAICFYRMSDSDVNQEEKGLNLLQLIQPTLRQSITTIMAREKCQVLKQILDFLPNQDDPWGVMDKGGQLLYQNKAFSQLLEEFSDNHSWHRLINNTVTSKNKCYSKIGKRLYGVKLSAINSGASQLNLVRLTRVTDENIKTNRKLQQAGLTNREQEIAMLIYHGQASQQIAGHLNLSYHTVRNHIKHIYSKLGVTSRSHLLNWDG